MNSNWENGHYGGGEKRSMDECLYRNIHSCVEGQEEVYFRLDLRDNTIVAHYVSMLLFINAPISSASVWEDWGYYYLFYTEFASIVLQLI